MVSRTQVRFSGHTTSSPGESKVTVEVHKEVEGLSLNLLRRRVLRSEYFKGSGSVCLGTETRKVTLLSSNHL